MSTSETLWSEDEFLHKVSQVPLQKIVWRLAHEKAIEISVRRDDLLDTELSGNKFYKLYYNLVAAQSAGIKTLLSFGGAHSNHIHALAAAGRRFGFKTLGVIRGEKPLHLSPTLLDATHWGMELLFIPRESYQQKESTEFETDFLDNLRATRGDFWLIPEGGSNHLGVKGVIALGNSLQEALKQDYTAVCVACGTGSTLAGIAAGLGNKVSAVGFSVLKGEGDLAEQVKQRITESNSNAQNWRLISGFHGGGYAKKLTKDLQNFLCDFETETQLKLDPVYTVKMFWGVAQLMQQDYWPTASRLVLIHSGGLQGRRGFGM